MGREHVASRGACRHVPSQQGRLPLDAMAPGVVHGPHATVNWKSPASSAQQLHLAHVSYNAVVPYSPHPMPTQPNPPAAEARPKTPHPPSRLRPPHAQLSPTHPTV